MDLFSNPEVVKKLALAIKKESVALAAFKIMHVCGTHERTISRSGLRQLLPATIDVVCGPGCPVCCTPAEDIDALIELSFLPKTIVTCFADLLRVPGNESSLSLARAQGASMRTVCSVTESLELARKNPGIKVVHSAVGFETTAPTTASAVKAAKGIKNFFILSSHRLIPPAMDFLLSKGPARIDGFIAPGHVSVITGALAYEQLVKKHKKPIVIAGFEPVDILYAIYLLIKQFKAGRPAVEIEYSRAVKKQPQAKAVKLMDEVFDKSHGLWRGIGKIDDSGLELKKSFKRFDVLSNFSIKPKPKKKKPSSCKCSQVLQGLIKPDECPLFAKACTAAHPVGPCMVTSEGSCSIYYRYHPRPLDKK